MAEINKCVQKGNNFKVFHENLLKSPQIDAYLHQFGGNGAENHSKSALLQF
ncbi:hypothetical protein HQN88_07745 [Paenibacillus qinlingensis]|nr:hypothetical protein [Paenibacillus qinlingensis]